MAVVGGFIAGMFGGAGLLLPGSMAVGVAAGATFAATTWGGIAVKLLTSVALSALSQALMETPKQEVAGLRTSTTLSGGVNPEAFCIGPYATDGAFVGPPMSCDASGGNTPNAILHYVIELAGIPGHGLDGLILDGEVAEILPDHIHPDHGNRIGGRFLGKAWIRYYDGTQTAADPYLVSRYPIGHVRPWTADMIGSGICYAILTFLYDREVWTGWPKARFVLRGLPLYDPRSDSTAGGLGPMRWGDPSTYLPTRNLAIQIYNILRGIHLPGGQVWGGEAQPEDLPYAGWAAAMNACGALVDDGAGGTEAQYRGGFEIFAEDEPFAVIEKLLRACNGHLTEHGGIWRLRIGGPGLPVMFISDDDILIDAPQELDPFPAPDEIRNAISATYPDPSRLWESSESPLLTNEDWEAEDGGRRLPEDLALDACPYPLQAQRIIAALINDHRRLLRHMLTLPPEAGVLEPGDVIAWTSVANGYAVKLFEVAEIVREARTWRTRVSLREVDPEDYDPPEGLVLPSPPSLEVVRPAAQAVPGWDAVPAIIVDAESNARRPAARAVWDAAGAVDARGVRVAVRLAGAAGDGRELGIYDLRAGEAFLDPALPATAYEMRGRLAVDRATDWTAWTAVTTPDVRIGAEDLAPDIVADLAALHDWIDDGQVVPDEMLREIRAGLRDLSIQLIESGARALLHETQIRDAAAQASYVLGTRVEETESGQAATAAAVTDLAAQLPGFASSTALAGLQAFVERRDADIDATASSVIAIGAELDDMWDDIAASVAAVTSLDTRLTVAEGRISASAEALISLGALTPAGLAQAILRMTAESGPSGVAARIGLKALAGNSSDDTRVAALFLDALAGGGSRVVIQGDALYLMVGSSTTPLFVADSSGLRINSGLIRLTGDVVVEGSFRVIGSMIDAGAVSRRYYMGWQVDNGIYNPSSPYVVGNSVAASFAARTGSEDNPGNPVMTTLSCRISNPAPSITFMLQRQDGSNWTTVYSWTVDAPGPSIIRQIDAPHFGGATLQDGTYRLAALGSALVHNIVCTMEQVSK
ncbi:phage tail protein [Pseudogemmobacter sonorensis]|uniref:phage tail protein n=1 Tax=Pseudogemmobacter sonorensis TaxID=2989681 RepID=UPI0036BA1D8F